MRVCLMIEGQEGVTWQQWVALADACERHGFEGLFRSDHYLSTIGDSGKPCLDAWATLAALAARTERIRLGTLVSPVTFRHASVLAKVVLTVDHVSGGRVELGLGAGWNETEHAAFGFAFPETKERMNLLEEQLELIRAIWTGDEPRALPKPVQRPHPPIVMGGEAGPRAAALAARFADEYNTFAATPDECRERKARLDAACERIGRDPATLRFSLMGTCIVGADNEDLVRRVRQTFEFVGLERDPETYIHERADSTFVGTVDTLAGRLRALEKVGVERVFLQHLRHEDLETLAHIGSELVPRVA